MPYVTLAATADQPESVIHYRNFGGQVGAPVLLLLHELGGSVETWHAFAERLAHNFNVVGFDQRCAGASEKRLEPFTLWDLANDTNRFAEALVFDRPFALMGLAMGAVTALHFAARFPASLSALVLCDGTASIDERASRYLLDRAGLVRTDGMRAVADMSFRNAFRSLPDAESRPEWRDYKARFICNAPIAYALQSEALAGCHLNDDDFANIKVRTLALTGRNDFIWPPAVGEALAAKLSNARFEVVENAAHFPPLQAPDWVAGRVAAFLGEH
jgi:3-oxoadipate enol-lactonase